MDDVAQAMSEWRRRKPDLDVDTMEIVLRLARLGGRVAKAIDPVHERSDLQPGDFDVLATLLRGGPCTPTELARGLLLSKAGMSGRLLRLASRGLVDEARDARDGRGKVITLTSSGRDAVADALPHHVAAERSALAPLSDDERHTLLELLRKATGEDAEEPNPRR